MRRPVVALWIVTTACAASCGPKVREPTASQVKQDLVGRRLTYGTSGSWVFHPSDELEELEIEDTLRGCYHLAHLIRMRTRHRGSRDLYEIGLVALYRYDGAGFELTQVLSNRMLLHSTR